MDWLTQFHGSPIESALQWETVVRWLESFTPILRDATGLIIFCWATVLLPLSILPRMHPLIAKSLRLSSLLVGLGCWCQAIIVTYRLLGWLPVATGLLFAGVGVVPLALVSSAQKQDWFVFGNLLATAALTIFARLIAKGISNRDARKKAAARDLRYYAHD